MKKSIFILLFSLLFNTCYASSIYVTVKNMSPNTIQVTKENGVSVIIPPYNQLYNVALRTRSHVYNYVGGMFTCEWYIHSSISEITHELIYNPEYARRTGASPCTKIITRIFN